MPKINNETVAMGDKLYDLVNGVGKVVSISENAIEIKFDNGRRITFNQYGMLNGIRRLYWHNPIIAEPPKRLEEWNIVAMTANVTFQMFNKYLDERNSRQD